MALGFLLVYSEPGSLVSIDEYNDWYDNEHIPLRLNHLPSFLSGARYYSSDSQKPSWAALYEIDDTSTFEAESYTRLRVNRSPREDDLVKRLEVLDRRACEVLADSGDPDEKISTGLNVGKPSGWLVIHGLGPSGVAASNLDSEADASGVRQWFADSIANLKGVVQGWVRSRMVKCFDTLKTGVSVPSGPEAQIVPKYLIIHELLSQSSLDETIERLNQQLSSSFGITETRQWKLHRAYPCIAKGNI